MHIEIRTEPFRITIHGYSGIASGKHDTATTFKLMDKMWQVVKSKQLPNKGLNVWVYEEGMKVFAGVELNDVSSPELEKMSICLEKYAYFKHIGPYHLIRNSGEKMIDELKRKGHETTLPYIEIYEHWNDDETKLETELIMSLK